MSNQRTHIRGAGRVVPFQARISITLCPELRSSTYGRKRWSANRTPFFANRRLAPWSRTLPVSGDVRSFIWAASVESWSWVRSPFLFQILLSLGARSKVTARHAESSESVVPFWRVRSAWKNHPSSRTAYCARAASRSSSDSTVFRVARKSNRGAAAGRCPLAELKHIEVPFQPG